MILDLAHLGREEAPVLDFAPNHFSQFFQQDDGFQRDVYQIELFLGVVYM